MTADGPYPRAKTAIARQNLGIIQRLGHDSVCDSTTMAAALIDFETFLDFAFPSRECGWLVFWTQIAAIELPNLENIQVDVFQHSSLPPFV
jgi:hypothetical protein